MNITEVFAGQRVLLPNGDRATVDWFVKSSTDPWVWVKRDGKRSSHRRLSTELRHDVEATLEAVCEAMRAGEKRD